MNEIDQYIATFPSATQAALEQIRSAIRKTAPQATEVISYGMPAYKLHGILVYFAGYDHHIGFYPTPSGIAAFQEELASYKSAKGSVQFPLDQPMPLALVERMVRFRVQEDLEKTAAKAKKSGKKL